MEERDLDVRGLECPQPVIRTKQALDQMAEGTLRVLVSKEVQSCNVLQAAQDAGYEAQSEDLGDCYRVTIQKTAGAGKPTADEWLGATCAPDRPAGTGTALLLTSDRIGADNEELGRLLVRLMLQTLSESDHPPTHVVLMNSGVGLACQGAATVEALRALVNRGTKLLVCGTCLDFLHLLDRLEVGIVSNMYDILEALGAADRVLAP